MVKATEIIFGLIAGYLLGSAIFPERTSRFFRDADGILHNTFNEAPGARVADGLPLGAGI